MDIQRQRRGKLSKKISVFLLISLVTLVTLAGCQPAPPTPEPEGAITVMTYNILMGASADAVPPWAKELAAQKGYPGNRLPRVLEVIKAADPDILGIQEAPQWDIGSPSTAQQVADELGMNYFIGESTNPESGFLHVVLFTKFDIKEAESYPLPITKAALRAELVTPTGESIHVFIVHLHHADPEIRMTELSFVLGEMELYINDLTMLMGDMNFPHLWGITRLGERLPGKRLPKYITSLYEAGWCHCSGELIDQIWTSLVLEPYAQPGPKIPSELTEGTSDHRPVVAKVGIPPR